MQKFGLQVGQQAQELADSMAPPPRPPVVLRDPELLIFNDLAGMRPASFWNPGRLQLLVGAARALHRVNEADKAMARPDFEPVLTSAKGGAYMNPMLSVRSQSMATAMTALRGLGLTVAPNASVSAANSAERVNEARSAPPTDDLIPGLAGPAMGHALHPSLRQ